MRSPPFPHQPHRSPGGARPTTLDDQMAKSVPLVERDTARPAEEQGLFHKFDVRRVDGSDGPGGKHHGCRYFVLDVDHDQHAADALIAYACACETTHPQLAKDLRNDWQIGPLEQAPAPQPVQEQEPFAWYTTDIRGRIAETTDFVSVADVWREQGYTVRPLYRSSPPEQELKP